MRSRTPKVLHPIAGRPMVDLVLDSCREAGVDDLVLVANPAQPAVVEHVRGRCEVVLQPEQKGTGHALAQVPAGRLAGRDVIVINADSPLVRPETIRRLYQAHRSSAACATLATVDDPGRRDGRIIRGRDGGFERIVEDKDAGEAERRVHEVNVGLYCFRGAELVGALKLLRPENRAGELYLTDVFEHLRPVTVVRLQDAEEAIGINDRVDLARAEGVLRSRVLEDLMRSGVSVADPRSCFVDPGVTVGTDTILEPFTILRGRTVVGGDCRIGPFAQIVDSVIGHGCRIEAAWLRECNVGDGSDCGPFSKLRPGAEIASDVHVGSFAEVVRSRVGSHSAIPHFSYVGDAVIGENVNIGAGTVTVNYDGKSKHRTEIGDGAFIGSDTMLRAPVKVGRGSRTGAGSVVTRDVPDGETAAGVPARVLRRRTENR
jgi:bifunctional UDP-N-acetylglucosamine pyrophosphorylase / glucosamine-1-phosphate N-acetyltransferase